MQPFLADTCIVDTSICREGYVLNNHKGLTAWQLMMLALGTVIGGSFFLGSAVAIRAAGPGIMISFVVGGVLVYAVLYALSEMTVADPAPGSFRTFAEKAYGPMAGFVVGWVYWTGMVLAMSSEAIAVSALIKNWIPAIAVPLLGSMVIVLVTALNLFGADRLSKLESGLAAVKLSAIIGFILLGAAIMAGFWGEGGSRSPLADTAQPILPAGLGGLAGSMLIVMFSYAGFEIIGLAASETSNPVQTVPQAIRYTVAVLVVLYVATMGMLLLLVPANSLPVDQSPLVSVLLAWNFTWAANVMATVLVTAILSTMLAAMFGLGRMLRSLAEEGHAPIWIQDSGAVPYKGIILSGIAMLAGLGLGLLLPEQVYLFLVSSGGFSLLFSYAVILLTHYKLRSIQGCPPAGKCQLPGYPFTSWLAITGIVAVIFSMPLIPGQGSGLVAGLVLVLVVSLGYGINKAVGTQKMFSHKGRIAWHQLNKARKMQFETARELLPTVKDEHPSQAKKKQE